MRLEQIVEQIKNGQEITYEQTLWLYQQPLDILCKNANNLREHFCGNDFDLCTIINGKSGQCSEDCKFCAQSCHYKTDSPQYSLLDTKTIVESAKQNYEQGVLRYSIVTSGKRLTSRELDQVCQTVQKIKEQVPIRICVSLGLLNTQEFLRLKQAGVTRIHNNLETSERYFSKICTTHSFQDKIEAILAAQQAGLVVCSGGIMGMGETYIDRIDMAFSLKKMGIKSVPINILNPISGTPLQDQVPLSLDEVNRIIAIYRFILPDASLRLAGGRGLLADKGKSCFISGANSAISGDMLTTAGITVQTDLEMIHQLGYKVVACHG